MIDDRQWIEKRAYELWEAEGFPEGKDPDHWYRATEEYQAISEAAGETIIKTRSSIKVNDGDDNSASGAAKGRVRKRKEAE